MKQFKQFKLLSLFTWPHSKTEMNMAKFKTFDEQERSREIKLMDYVMK